MVALLKVEWIFFGFVVLVLLSAKKAVEVLNMTDHLGEIALAAQPVAHESGIPISYIVAQAAHESNYGKSGLAQKSKNLFGIKADHGWIGPSDNYPTTEFQNGKEIKINAYFRKYSTWEASVRDWVKFISSPRYAKAYAAALANDAKGFFKGLQDAGYATDPQYADSLVHVLNSIKGAIV